MEIWLILSPVVAGVFGATFAAFWTVTEPSRERAERRRVRMLQVGVGPCSGTPVPSPQPPLPPRR